MSFGEVQKSSVKFEEILQMKLFTISLVFALFSLTSIAQKIVEQNKKGAFYFYWGWNRGAYTNTDIHFHGTNYDFTLRDVAATDRQSKFDPNIYFNPKNLTIPQYNLRLGYFIKDNYSLSFGADHMKYVMVSGQSSVIDGYISNSGTGYDGIYSDQPFVIAKDFLLFEHTDGLNYLNFELRRHDDIFKPSSWFSIQLNEGFGAGALMPRTNTTLLNNPRYDEFHLAGYGAGVVGSVCLTFFNYFFIQSEWKGGYINMPDIRTTMHKSDRADESFFFSQYNILFGANFNLAKKEKPTE